MSEIALLLDGTDITAGVLFSDARFEAMAKSGVGSCSFRIKDVEHEASATIGKSIVLEVDGIRVWGGYVEKVSRGYFFDAYDCRCKVHVVPRYLLVEGVDHNVLLNKRVLYDKDTPTNLDLTSFPAGTADDVIVKYYVQHHTDLPGDDVTTSLVENVAVPYPDTDISGSASWTVQQLFTMLAFSTGAIWYIDPDRNLVWTDVDTPNAPKGISDNPDGTEVGARELDIDFGAEQMRNDALVWGVGQGSQQPVFKRTTSEESIEEHSRWQVSYMAASVWRQTTVNRIAHSYVFGSPQSKRGGKDDRVTVRATIYQPTFQVAMKVAVRVESFDYEDVLPIRHMRITFPTPSDARFDLTLGHDIDDPWSTFEFWFPDFEFQPPIIDIWGPPVVLPPHHDCTDDDGIHCCVETYSRTELDGWGTGEFGIGWTNTKTSGSGSGAIPDPVILIEGRASLPLPSPGPAPNGSVMQNMEALEISPTVPMTLAVLSEFEPPTAAGNDNLFNGFIDMRVSADQVSTINITMPANPELLNIRGSFFDAPASLTDSFDMAGWQPGRLLWVKARYEVDNLKVKAWWDGTVEPLAWILDFTDPPHPVATGIPNVIRLRNVGSGGDLPGQWYIHRVEICEGLSCNGAGEPIDSDCTDPDPWDVSQRQLCETLTRIDTPPNQTEDWAYYQASYQMAFGSDQVWVDGLRFDTRDYTVIGDRDVIAFYDRLSLGGLDAHDSPKTVYACYIATQIGIV